MNPFILIVEDDDSLAMGLEFSILNEQWGARIAKTLYEAEQLFLSHTFDLVLLDNKLPDGLGLDFCRSIRKSSNVPIIFLTASDEEVNIVLGLEIGADDYIVKPFRVKELISRIKAVLRRTKLPDTAPSVIRTGKLMIRPIDWKVYYNGRDMYLSPTEFRLLYCLVRHPQQILSRNQILQQLWDIEGEYIDNNTLSVHIRRLREKIEPDPSNPIYIITIRGVGYKWDQRSESQG